MSSYGGVNLFASGPHRFEVGGVSQRHVRHESPGADGERITVMGRTGRSITQTGTLIADDVAGLTLLTGAIETAMSGDPSALIDDRGRAWGSTLMLALKLGDVYRIGPRLAVDYRIAYSQVQP